MKSLAEVFGICLWVFGIILAKGVLSTICALFIPLWAWYLAIEYLLIHYGVLNG